MLTVQRYQMIFINIQMVQSDIAQSACSQQYLRIRCKGNGVYCFLMTTKNTI